jgi:electron transfer flavoprotein beta subunit
MMTRPLAVTDEADEFTTSRIFTPGRRYRPCFASGTGLRRRCPAVNVVVCVKQIPDPAVPGELDPNTHWLKREGKLILDDSDAYGVEMALQLATAAGGGDVTLVSMAPNGETSGLRTALAMGAASAILVSDDALKGSDALSTAKVLAAAIKRVEGADLIITATEATDGYTGTVPEQLAALLGLPSVTFAKKIEAADGKVKVERQTEAGYDEVEAPMPVVVSVTAGVVEPRYPSFKGIMAAKSKPVDTLTVADLGLDGQVGAANARQEIVSVTAAEERQAGEIVEDDGEGFQKIVAFLESKKVI